MPHPRNHAAHLRPLAPEESQAVNDILDVSRNFGGYVPTSLKIMAHKPNILRAFSALIHEVMRAPGEVPPTLKWLTAHAVSTAAACRYCMAHTAANGAKAGLAVEKSSDLLNYETSPLYTPPERAVIALGFAAGAVPNASERAHFDALREYFSDAAIVEIVAVISLFGWLNRWNDTLSSDLEEAPLAFARKNLAARGWSAGKHAAGGAHDDAP